MTKIFILSLQLTVCAVICNVAVINAKTIASNEDIFANISATNVEVNLRSKRSASFNQDCLNAHNSYRDRHGVPRLTLDNNINSYAQQWAETLGKSGQFYHRPNNKYGENLYYISGAAATGATAVKAWYDEIKYYNYNNPGFSSATGHFTQVVWKSSKRLGVGVYTSGRRTVVVCNYDPPGNYLGQFPANVLRPRN